MQTSSALTVEVTLVRSGLRILAQLLAPPGMTVLLGPSGSGKSTMLDAIAGHLRPVHGRIALGGQAVFDAGRMLDVPPHRRRIGYVPQSQALFPHLDVRENLRYGLFHLPRKDAAERVARMAAEMGLSTLLSRLPASLSGGERQRVALGRALLIEPRALLLDEPLSAVDAASRRGLLELLRAVAGRLGIPVLHVTHNEEEANFFGQQILRYREAPSESGLRTVVLTREDDESPPAEKGVTPPSD